MKLIRQKVELVQALKHYSQTIEQRGRVCYKSEDRITDESSEPFVKGIVKRGHDSVLEMDGIFIAIDTSMFDRAIEICDICTGFIDMFEESSSTRTLYVSGTFRALKEFCLNSECIIADILYSLLSTYFPIIVDDIDEDAKYVLGDHELTFCSNEDHNTIKEILGKEDDDVSNRLLIKACRKCFKFTTNRAVSHELVRHRPNIAFLQESQRYVRYGGDMEFIIPEAFHITEDDMKLWEEACSTSEQMYGELLKNNSPQASRLVLPNSTKTEIIVCATLQQWRHIFFMRCSSAADPSMQEIMVQALELFVEEMGPIVSITNKRRKGDDRILSRSRS